MPGVRLTLRCNNQCIMCGQVGLANHAEVESLLPPPGETTAACFIGGEPTLAPDLLQWVQRARAAGYEHIGIQTNGRDLARRLPELAGAGLTFAHFSIHGASASVHDYHTGSEGSFAEITEALGACRVSGVAAVATTVLTRSNCRVLSPLPDLLESNAIQAWMITVPHVAGRAATDFDRVVPRIGLALPYALHALRAAERISLPARISGAPVCSLGPFADRAHPSDPRSYGQACAECAAQPTCPGLDPIYLTRFAADELKARAPGPAPTPDPIWRFFAGAGELAAPDQGTVVHEAPATARRHLPMLGKGKPAVAEARPDSGKTGEALGELFPALFDSTNANENVEE